MDDERYMSLALDEARSAVHEQEVPVGAILIVGGSVVGRGHNLRERWNDPTAHAEMIAIRQASQSLRSWRIANSCLYVTLEPCIMCMGASILARVERIVYGAKDPKGGAAGSLYDLSCDMRLNHRIDVVGGVLEEESAELLRGFFRELRARRVKAG